MTGSESLDVPNDGFACAFCDYLAGIRPYSIVCRSELTAVLVTREQRGVAHVLVMPTRHCPTILELTIDEANALMQSVIDAARAIDVSEARPGIAIWQNNGVPAKQTIAHVHFHVAGTLPGGGTNWGTVAELSVEDTDEIASRLRPHLPA